MDVYTLGVDFGGYFLLSGPFMTDFGLIYLFAWPPNICLALAIFSFYYGVINFFFYFYSGLYGGITMTGGFRTGFYYKDFLGESYFLGLS